MPAETLLTELFPIRAAALPRLTAYVLHAEDAARIGGKLAHRLRLLIGGRWLWDGERLLTDNPPAPMKLIVAVDQLRTQYARTFGGLSLVAEDVAWRETPLTLAEFVARGAFDALMPQIQTAIAALTPALPALRLERLIKVRPWVVGGAPALSLTVSARLLRDPRPDETDPRPADLVIDPADAPQYGLNAADAEKALALPPALRAQWVKAAADIGKAEGLIEAAYNEQNAPAFFSRSDAEYEIRWGGGKVRPYDPQTYAADFTRWGAVSPLGRPLRVAALNALGEDAELYLEALGRDLARTHQTPLEIVKLRRVGVINAANLESGLRALAKLEIDLLLGFFPDSRPDTPALAEQFKADAIARGLASMVVSEHQLHQTELTPLVIAGMLARAGAQPTAFEEPLPYADLIGGLAIVRQTKKGKEQLHAALRLYSNRGVALGWRAAQAVVSPGAGLPVEVLETLLPPDTMAFKRLLLHSLGGLAAQDVAALADWETRSDVIIQTVELLQRDLPRLYGLSKGSLNAPTVGSAFLLSDHEALYCWRGGLRDALPAPLYVRTMPPLRVHHALDSIVRFTHLSYNEGLSERLPATLVHQALWEAAVQRGQAPNPTPAQGVWWL